MTDACDIDVDLGDGLPIEIDVGTGVPASVIPLDGHTPIDVDMEAIEALAAELSSVAPIDVQPAAVPAVGVDIDSSDPIDVIVGLIMGLTAEQFDRLNAAITDLEVNPYKVFDSAWVTTTTPTVAFGDGTQLALSSTYKEVAYGIIPCSAFQDSGFLEILSQVNATESNVAGGSIRIYWSLESAPMPVAGVYQAYTQHYEKSVVFTFAANGSAAATLDGKVKTTGSTSDAWSQRATGLVFIAHGAVEGIDPFSGPFSPVFDPTEKRFFRLQCRATLSGTQTAAHAASSCLLFNPRDGTCHAL